MKILGILKLHNVVIAVRIPMYVILSLVEKENFWNKLFLHGERMYQQGVPTNVFLTRCLSPESKRQAETPKSPSFMAPRAPIRIFPAYKMV